MLNTIASNSRKRSQQLPWMTPLPGSFVSPTIANDGISATSGAATRIELFPFTVRGNFNLNVTNFAIGCPGAVASATVRILVYGSDGYGRPDALLYQSEDLDLSTTGLKQTVSGIPMALGSTYWLGVHHSSTASINTVFYAATPDLNGSSDLGIKKTIRRMATYGSPPNPWVFNPAEMTSFAAPAILLKV